MSFKNLDSQLLEKTELNKLYLVRLFYTDFDKILNNETTDLLNQTWQNMKIDLKKWFNNYEISLDTIVENFKEIIITTDSRIALRYNPLTNIVSSNILELLFSQANIGKNKFVCSISWKLASQLIHEFDHYLLFREKNLVEKNEMVKFGKIQDIRIEKRAILRQIDFLKHCMKNVPIFTFVPFVKVATWTANGQAVLDNESVFRRITKDDMIKGIESYISYLRSDIKRSLDQYQLHSEKNNMNQNIILLKALALYNKNIEDTREIKLVL